MRYIIVFLLLFVTCNAKELSFVSSSLDGFILYGMPKHVAYKTKEQRNSKISHLWEKFLSSNRVNLDDSRDKKIYVVYFNYKANSFDCFIGIQSTKKLNRLSQKKIPKSNYYRSIISYSKSMDMDKLWERINKQKLKRSFKQDIEVYKIEELTKKQQFIKIYLSKK